MSPVGKKLVEIASAMALIFGITLAAFLVDKWEDYLESHGASPLTIAAVTFLHVLFVGFDLAFAMLWVWHEFWGAIDYFSRKK